MRLDGAWAASYRGILAVRLHRLVLLLASCRMNWASLGFFILLLLHVTFRPFPSSDCVGRRGGFSLIYWAFASLCLCLVFVGHVMVLFIEVPDGLLQALGWSGIQDREYLFCVSPWRFCVARYFFSDKNLVPLSSLVEWSCFLAKFAKDFAELQICAYFSAHTHNYALQTGLKTRRQTDIVYMKIAA